MTRSGGESRKRPGEISEPEPRSRGEGSAGGAAKWKMRRRDESSRAHERARRHKAPHNRAGYRVAALGEGDR